MTPQLCLGYVSPFVQPGFAGGVVESRWPTQHWPSEAVGAAEAR